MPNRMCSISETSPSLSLGLFLQGGLGALKKTSNEELVLIL